MDRAASARRLGSVSLFGCRKQAPAMKSYDLIPNVEAVPEEGRLLYRARSGEADAFVQLYDVYGDDVFRYVYFRVLSDVAAEAITAQVFRQAWDNLDSQENTGLSFAAWIYAIARNQVLTYYNVNLRSDAFNPGPLLAAADYHLNHETQDLSSAESWSSHLKLLTGDFEQSELQSTAALIMREYLDYLNPRRLREPHPTFNAYTRAWLTRYLQLRPRGPIPSPMGTGASSRRELVTRGSRVRVPSPRFVTVTRRMAMVSAVLMAALLFTGTAKAQSALPGDALYGWKRTSEQVWLSVSPDRVGTEIALADRRLAEWIAVEHDPVRSEHAQRDYSSMLTSLEATGGAQSRARVLPVLQAHEVKLEHSGLSSAPLTAYLAAAASFGTTPQTVAANDGDVAPSATPAPTNVLPTATSSLTDMVPTLTQIPPDLSVAGIEGTPTASQVPKSTDKVNQGQHKGQNNGKGNGNAHREHPK
jgi:DNA-directed RNA polymerase specialized sigma24 family protein